MGHAVPHVEALVANSGFTNIQRGSVPPVLQYVHATKPL
jgi:hypothetical protein